jgi:hypothetical protein
MKEKFFAFPLCLILFLIGCTSSPSSKTPQNASAVTNAPYTTTPILRKSAANTPAETESPAINPEMFSFVSLGDRQIEAANFTTKVSQVATLHPNLVIFNGDLEVKRSGNTEINPEIISISNAGLFNQTFFVRGNHDNGSSGSSALWESTFPTSSTGKALPSGVTDYVSLNSSPENLSLSFIFGNSMFISLDVPGDADLLTSDQLSFLDSRLTYGESNGLIHAFIFFHGHLYCVESTNCDCKSPVDASCTPSALVEVLNKHPIVSASFNDHEYILGWTHMDKNKVEVLTTNQDVLITPPSDGSTYNAYLSPARMDYTYMDVGSSQGFAAITVNGPSFSVHFYKIGTSAPVWTKTFTKGDPVAIGTSTAVARPVKYYVVDRVRNNADFATLAAWGINTAIVSFDINGKSTTWQSVFVEAGKYDINIVIWPSDWKNPRPNCDWEAPFPISSNGDITKVKPLLDVASQYSNFIGIVNGHEYLWTCTNMTFDEMAGLKNQLKAYALTKGRMIKIWNYTSSLYDESMLPASQIPRIMDVAVIWKHCAGDTTARCAGNNSTLARVKNSRARLKELGLGGKVDLVFITQTFTTDAPYNVKSTLSQLENFSCEVLHTTALDGFGFYTWDAGWWPDLHNWPDLYPAILFTHDNCIHANP